MSQDTIREGEVNFIYIALIGGGGYGEVHEVYNFRDSLLTCAARSKTALQER
jgi:hypothetical protein